MAIKTILLTGDDGYNAVGIKILIDILGNDYQLKIAGTKSQQSGVAEKVILVPIFRLIMGLKRNNLKI